MRLRSLPRKNLPKVVDRKLAAFVIIEEEREEIDEDTGEVLETVKERKVILPMNINWLKKTFWRFPMRESSRSLSCEMSKGMRRLIKARFSIRSRKDSTHNEEEALEYMYMQLRGTEAPDLDTARGVLERLFFSEKRYDLGEVGRYRINRRLRLNEELDTLNTYA